MSYGIGTSLLFVLSYPFPTAHPETALLLGSLQRSDSRASSPLPGPRQHSHKQALATKPADDVADRDQFCPRKSCGTTVCFSEQKGRGAHMEACGSQCVLTAHLPPTPRSVSHFGGLTPALLGVSVPWKVASATYQGFPCPPKS